MTIASPSTSARRVLVITGDPIGVKLAGPAIRAWKIAEALLAANEVTLMTTTSAAAIEAPFPIVTVRPGDSRGFARWEQWADVIIFQGHAMESFVAFVDSQKIIVADIYDPMHLEQLEQAKSTSPTEWNDRVHSATASLNQQLLRADFFICASERQRFFYLGQLAALGRVNPANYALDPDLDALISIVPFGLARDFPEHDTDVLKGVLPGIGVDDKLMLWSGGLYDWFDPDTLIRAVAILAQRRPHVRLFFQGTKHPNPDVPEMGIVARSRELARSLGQLDSTVFFNDSWVDYANRHNYLREADIGVSTHHAHLETTMSFRTRILDYLWAELPMVVTEGDVFADLVTKHTLGVAVAAEDPEALADALERALFDENFIAEVRANIRRVRQDFYWDRVLEPLVSFVAQARHAPDMTASRRRRPELTEIPLPLRRSGVYFVLSRGWFHLRHGGPKAVLSRIGRKLPDA